MPLSVDTIVCDTVELDEGVQVACPSDDVSHMAPWGAYWSDQLRELLSSAGCCRTCMVHASVAFSWLQVHCH